MKAANAETVGASRKCSLELNEGRNGKNASLISTGSRAAVRVIRTDEELMIARSTIRVLGLGAMRVT
jgi:acetate kinase